MRICYVFPSRSRPDKFFSTLENIIDNSFSENFFIWCKLDQDDSTMNNVEVIERLQWYDEVTVKWGLSKNKVHAVNRDMEDLPPCDILVLVSDDIKWTTFGFDEEIREAFAKFSPDFSSVIHFPEEKSADRTMILTVMGINLYKKLGHLYHPDYESVYCDNQLTEMCRKMGKYHYVNKILYVHNHAIWGKAEWDDLYRYNERPEVYKKDHETYLRHKKNNFGL